jgi:hypothetical protein
MSARDQWIRRHLRRLRFGQFLHRAGEWVGGYLFAFGAIVLIVKVLIPSLWPHVLWGAVGAAACVLVAWRLSCRGRFTRTESVALLDTSLGAGGLLMSLQEAPDSEWESRLPHVERLWRSSLPRIRPRRFAWSVGLPLLFTVAVCFVPLRSTSATPLQPRTAGQQAAEQLEEMLQTLEEADVLEEEQQEELREEIAKLAEETKDSPLTHERWETVDALEQRMRLKLDEAAALADKASGAAQMLAELTDGDLSSLSAEQREQLEQQFLETLQKMQQTGALNSASQSLREQLQQLMQNGRLNGLPRDPSQRKQLLSDLQKFLEQEQRKLAEARKQCQGGKCSRCGSGQCPGCEGEGECEGQNGTTSRDGDGRPGRGGVNRGRGDAELTWGDESDEQGTKFKETVLPPGFQEDPKDDLQGVSLAPPDESPDASAPHAAPREVDPASGRETWDRPLRPRHRDVVRQYFNEPGNAE